MLKPGDRHLTEDELDRLTGISPPGSPSAVQPDQSLESSEGHLAECADCRSRFEHRMTAAKHLALLRAPSLGIRSEHCPSDEEWMNAAAGLTKNDMSRRMIDHATSCDYCGPLFRELLKQFSDDSSPQESQVLESLRSASSEWQTSLAARLSAQSRAPDARRQTSAPFWTHKWRALALAAGAVAAVFLWMLWPRPERRVESLITRAYTERRNLELRIPGAQFGPVRMYRAAQISHMDSPPALLEAEKEIASNLTKHPSDPFWLQSRARAELLEGNYVGAIESLREALLLKPDSPSLLIDLATAYSQRADANGSSEDFGQAIDLLGQALKYSPRDLVAIFNRALISRKALLFSQAIEDWQRYLELDPKGKWADEARSRLEEVRQEQRKRGSLGPLLAPSQFAELPLDDALSVAQTDQRIEAYTTAALLEWVPAAYPVDVSERPTTRSARLALASLARLALDRHADGWWTDLLRSSASPHFPQALAYLSSAIEANESGDSSAAHRDATLAMDLFRSIGPNDAGILRASVEDLYAFNIEQDAEKCAHAMRPLRQSPKWQRYRWLGTEFHIQEGNCRWLQEDLGRARDAYSQAESDARNANYRAIQLGAQDHWSMAAGAGGDYAGAWRKATQGLQQFWEGDFADVRGYNFYYSLYEVARFRHEPYLEVSIWKDALPLTEASHDLAQVAVAHSLYANSALATEDSSLAAEEFEKASQLFAKSPQIASTRMAYFEAQTRLAGVEARMGLNQRSLARLRPMELEVSQLSDNYLKILFYDCFGQALLSNGERTDGEKALRSAIGLAELQLRSVDDITSRAQWKLNASETYRDLVSLLAHNGDNEGSFQLWEEFKAAPKLPNVTPPGQVGASETHGTKVTSKLHELSTSTLVSYAVLPSELLTWVADNRGLNSYQTTISSIALSAAATHFRELCANPKSDPELVRRQARNLYNLLVVPFEGRLEPGRTLIFELDDELAGLPVEALVDANNRFLGERGPIISSLGIQYEPHEGAGSRVLRDATALVVAVPAPDSRFTPPLPPLPDVVSEAELVAGKFRSADLLISRNATLNETLARITTSTVFHFAGHASNLSVKPGLLLFDATLTVRTLEDANPSKMQLAVLSACDTEDGAGLPGDSNSVAGHLIRIGVPRVVASRWNVDSNSTREFMRLFYDHLLSGTTVEKAIYEAQSAMRAQRDRLHPFFWAAFTAFGSDTGEK